MTSTSICDQNSDKPLSCSMEKVGIEKVSAVVTDDCQNTLENKENGVVDMITN